MINTLNIPYQKSKYKTRTIIFDFKIKINTNVFLANLLSNKILKFLITIAITVLKISLNLEKVQFLTCYLYFCTIIVRLE